MRKLIISLASALLVFGYANADTAKTCADWKDDDKTDCGYMGINQLECEKKNCCW